MEKFKACEKEMKTKAFSKEGLTQSAKLDPKQREKLEATQWLQTQVEELLLQVEQAEAEVEALQGGIKKKNKGGQQAERLETLEHLNERRKWHISRLELILRLLDNGTMTAEKVNGLKDDVSYFVESNTVCIIPCSFIVCDLTSCRRMRTSMSMKGYTTSLTLMKRKRSLVLQVTIMRRRNRKTRATVCRMLISPGYEIHVFSDLPPRTPSKKQHDDESVTSSKRDGSPVLKKAPVTLQLRSKCPQSSAATGFLCSSNPYL